MRVIIQENERGLLFKHGKYVRTLKPGRNTLWGSGWEVEKVEMEAPFSPDKGLLDVFLEAPDLRSELQVFTVQDGSRGLLFKDGLYQHMLSAGVHAFLGKKYSVDTVPMDAEFSPPRGHLESYIEDEDLFSELEIYNVPEHQRGLLFHNGQFRKMLPPGQYVYWGSRFAVTLCDMEGAFKYEEGTLENFLEDPALATLLQVYDIQEQEIGLLYHRGGFLKSLKPGRHAYMGEFFSLRKAPVNAAFDVLGLGAEEENSARFEIFLNDPDLARILHVRHITKEQRGLLFSHGEFEKILPPGVHAYLGKNYSVKIADVHEVFPAMDQNLAVFLENPTLAQELEVVQVADNTVALHCRNGLFCEILAKGRYAFWNGMDSHTFQTVSIEEPLVSGGVPLHVLQEAPESLCRRFEVKDFEKGLLHYDGRFIRQLDGGAYYFWNNGVQVEVVCVDTRVQQLSLQGQELLTLDKVSVRVNCVCRYKINDYERISRTVQNYQEQIYALAQLALREYVGTARLDDLLENREQISSLFLSRLKEKELECCVTFLDAGVKDIILPGEIKEMIQSVLRAEKQAQANVITRREEVASTRSLLNTAKLLDENQTLMRLKEMEYQERQRTQLLESGERVVAALGDKVTGITLQGGDLMEQLGKLLKDTMLDAGRGERGADRD